MTHTREGYGRLILEVLSDTGRVIERYTFRAGELHLANEMAVRRADCGQIIMRLGGDWVCSNTGRWTGYENAVQRQGDVRKG
jgi:hypothetical protein